MTARGPGIPPGEYWSVVAALQRSEAEVERLKAALQTLVDADDRQLAHTPEQMDAARAALAPPP
jgi:hypothetical protein